MDSKPKIGLFLGGSSSEKEISLETGRHVYNSLDREKFEVIPIFVDRDNHLWHIEEGLLWMNTCTDLENALGGQATRIYYEDLSQKIDFAFLALHGKYSEECFPALLTLYHIPNNSAGVLGGSLGMDKIFQKKLLNAYEIQFPNSIGVSKEDYKDSQLIDNVHKKIESQLQYPVIVKPGREGSSVAITKVKDQSGLKPALDAAFKYDNEVLVEDFIKGQEITTTVMEVNGEVRALTPTETPSRGDFLTMEEKFLPGEATMITPPNLPPDEIEELKQVAYDTYMALDQHSCSRIDTIWQEGTVYVLEPNCPPGMTPSTMVFHQAAQEGWNAREFFTRVIEAGLSHQ